MCSLVHRCIKRLKSNEQKEDKFVFNLVLIKVNMNTYNKLVNCQRMFRNAVLDCNDNAKKYAMNYTRSKFPDIIEDVKKQWLACCPFKDLGWCNTYLLEGENLERNVRFYTNAINSRINQYNNWSVSSTAVQRIFFQPQPLSQDYVLYSKEEKELKVSDFLSVLSYGKKFAETFFGVDSSKASEYMLAVKTVDLAMNHKEVDKPLNKTLHIVNDVLTECAKNFQKDNDGKKVVSGISLLVDLAIDFLVKG